MRVEGKSMSGVTVATTMASISVGASAALLQKLLDRLASEVRAGNPFVDDVALRECQCAPGSSHWWCPPSFPGPGW